MLSYKLDGSLRCPRETHYPQCVFEGKQPREDEGRKKKEIPLGSYTAAAQILGLPAPETPSSAQPPCAWPRVAECMPPLIGCMMGSECSGQQSTDREPPKPFLGCSLHDESSPSHLHMIRSAICILHHDLVTLICFSQSQYPAPFFLR